MATDKTLFILCTFCIFIGIVFSLSLPGFTTLYFTYNEWHFFIRQAIVGIISIFVMWLLSQVNPDKHLVWIGFFIFFSSLFLMGIMHYLPESMVTSAGGAKRWVSLSGFKFAPHLNRGGGQVECVWTKEGSVNFVSDLEQGLNSVHA